MIVWQYLIVHLRDNQAVELNRLGGEGWECFCVDSPTGQYWLKRPLAPKEPLRPSPLPAKKETRK